MTNKAYYIAAQEALIEEFTRDPNCYYLGLDVKSYGGSIGKVDKLNATFPDRVLNMPLCEGGFCGFGVGMAWGGLRPVVELMFADYVGLCMDQLANAAAKMCFLSRGECTTPFVLRAGQGIGAQSGCNHSQSVEAWISHVPGIKVAVPTFPADIKGLLKYAIRDNDPSVFLESRIGAYTFNGPVPEGEYLLPFGIANVVREGTDLTVVAWHKPLMDTISIADELQAQGVSIEIVDPRTLVPLDKETLVSSVRKTKRLLIVHEATITGGPGAEIAAVVAEQVGPDLKAPIKRLANDDFHIPCGDLEHVILADQYDIRRTIKEMMGLPLTEKDFKPQNTKTSSPADDIPGLAPADS